MLQRHTYLKLRLAWLCDSGKCKLKAQLIVKIPLHAHLQLTISIYIPIKCVALAHQPARVTHKKNIRCVAHLDVGQRSQRGEELWCWRFFGALAMVLAVCGF